MCIVLCICIRYIYKAPFGYMFQKVCVHMYNHKWKDKRRSFCRSTYFQALKPSTQNIFFSLTHENVICTNVFIFVVMKSLLLKDGKPLQHMRTEKEIIRKFIHKFTNDYVFYVINIFTTVIKPVW